ncbi:MAG: hypothetical protein FWE11_09420 [Defluviitaleaceae bacterium]|nr:hypothetical protein [Defluviitaleaceae bacterium]
MQPTIHRSERICIDISDNVVSIIKLDPEGIMMRAGSAKAPSMPAVPDDAYVTDLSSAIRKAAWAAKVSMGFGASCVVVAGMQGLTMQRFTWPDLPEEALVPIANEEIIPYLPGDLSHFAVGCEVLKQDESSGTATIEVLAAAMPIEFAAAITTACKWANFKPKRMDLRENARGRLAHYWCVPVEGEVPTTYAILDIGPGVANIAFYYNGMFHSNRYFTPEMVKLNQVDDFELLMTVKTGGFDDKENAMHYAPEKLTGDIISAIGHFQRSIPGTRLSCVLLMDEENIPGIEENLRANVDMPVLKPSQWISPGLKRPNLRRVDQAPFLDAFAAGMPPLSNHGTRMDLRISDNPVTPVAHTGFQQVQKSEPQPIQPPPIQPDPVETFGSAFQAPTPEPMAFDDPIPPRPTEPLFDDPFPARPPEPSPFDDAFSARPPEPQSFDFIDPLEPAPAMHHEVPFEPIKAQADAHKGFPYAIPEDPRPPRQWAPIIAAVVIAAVVFIIAALIPLQETIRLRRELEYLESSIAGHTSADALILLETERNAANTQINARRTEISRINERRSLVRDFYLPPPALILLPEILEHSGLTVDSIEANEQQIVITGRTSAHAATATGTGYIRDRSPYHHLYGVTFEIIDPPTNGGPFTYSLTLNLRQNHMPFWLNGNVERRWQ